MIDCGAAGVANPLGPASASSSSARRRKGLRVRRRAHWPPEPRRYLQEHSALTRTVRLVRTFAGLRVARRPDVLVRVLICSGGNLLTVVIKHEEPHSR